MRLFVYLVSVHFVYLSVYFGDETFLGLYTYLRVFDYLFIYIFSQNLNLRNGATTFFLDPQSTDRTSGVEHVKKWVRRHNRVVVGWGCWSRYVDCRRFRWRHGVSFYADCQNTQRAEQHRQRLHYLQCEDQAIKCLLKNRHLERSGIILWIGDIVRTAIFVNLNVTISPNLKWILSC